MIDNPQFWGAVVSLVSAGFVAGVLLCSIALPYGRAVLDRRRWERRLLALKEPQP